MTDIDRLISESHDRCVKLGLGRQDLPQFSNILTEADMTKKISDYEGILSVINFFVQKMLSLMKGLPLLILITDDSGCILEMAGDETVRKLVKQSGICTSLIFTEEEAGTNSISLALMCQQPIQIVGSQHYYQFLESIACYTVPFLDTDSNDDTLGTITILTAAEQHNPFLLSMLCTLVDSVERELLLRKQNTRLHILNQIVIETTRNGIVITDKQENVTDYNRFGELLTSLDKMRSGYYRIQNETVSQYIKNVLETGNRHEDIELTISVPNTDPVVCVFDALPIYDETGRLMGSFAQFRDITDRSNVQRQINYLAYHDELTGLPNRRFFMQRLKELIGTSNHRNSVFAVMFLDLDQFKMINDSLGHEIGDTLLQLVSERIHDHVPASSVVARMGGDEFIILISEMNQISDVIAVAEQLLDSLKIPFMVEEYEIYVTGSIGIALYPYNGISSKALMKHADIAMYRAKERGKNNYVMFEHVTDNSGIEQLTLVNSLHKAFQNEEFRLVYQPQVDSRTGHIFGVEALVRWEHPTLGTISPETFIPIAEESGLIRPLGAWVLHAACRQLKTWRDQGFTLLRMSVNLSVRQFLKQNFVEEVEHILWETELDPHYLEFEITESMTMDVEYTVRILHQFKQLGIKINLDDCGTGYSNLFYLKKFSIDTLKIDRSFIRDIMTDNIHKDIVGSMVAMANNLKMDIIAEGVETIEQLNFLTSLGCYKVQGYLFYLPLSPNQMQALLAQTKFSYRLGKEWTNGKSL